MKTILNHPWNLSEDEALNLQKELSTKVIKTDHVTKVRYIAGVDVGYKKKSDKITAAIVILNSLDLDVIESVAITTKTSFPYISGLFSFRELPALLKAFEKVTIEPDLIVCDGQGYAHPRRFGLACHLGLLMDKPTIGCAKNLMLGKYDTLGEKRGDFSDLIDQEEIVGRAVRTQTDVNPVFVSVGHKISLDTAVNWILKLSPKYRLPETTRLADQLSKQEN